VRVCDCGCGEAVAPLKRFRKGHYRSSGYEQRHCIACGRPFKIPITADRRVCRNRRCAHLPAHVAEVGRVMALRASKHREQLLVLRPLARYERGEIRAARRRVADANRRWIQQRHDAEIATWLSTLDPADADDARALMNDQRVNRELRDSRSRERVQYLPSFDVRYNPHSDRTPLQRHGYGVVFDREDDEWLYRAAIQTRGHSTSDEGRSSSGE
jgi:hypothetical protein